MLLSICLVTSIPLLVLALAGASWVTTAVSDYVAQSYTSNVQSIAYMVDQQIGEFNTIASQLSITDWVRRILFMQGEKIDRNRVTDYDLLTYKDQILTIKKTHPIVLDLGVVFAEKDFVIGSYGNSNIHFFAENALHIDGLTEDNWRNMDSWLTFGQATVLDDVCVRKYGQPMQSSVHIYPLVDGQTDLIRAALFVVMPHTSLYKFLQPQLLQTAGSAALLRIQTRESEAPFFERGTLPAGKVRNIRAVSNETGWVFSVLLPETIVAQDALRIRNTLLLICAGIWVFYVVATQLITRRFFRPLQKIAGMLGLSDSDSRFIDEYESIQHALTDLQTQREKLHRELAAHQPMARAACVQQLLSHRDGGNVQRWMDVLELRTNWALYCVCLLIPVYGEQDAVLEGVQRSSASAQALPGRCDSNALLLLGAADKAALDALIVQALEDDPHCCCVLGEIVNTPGQLAHSYQTALTTQDYRLVSGGFRVLRYSDVLFQDGYYLPQDAEHKLLASIRSGDALSAVKCYDMLYRRNVEQSNATYASLHNFLSDLHLDVIQLCDEISAPAPQLHIAPGGPPDAAAVRMRENIVAVSKLFGDKIRPASAQLEDIQHFIQEYLFDRSLSLTLVADTFGLSNSMVSRLFSEHSSENFLSYINRMRIERACERLTSGDGADIMTVARSVGYDNDVTFRRLFKKYVGLTPSEYREQAQKRKS